MDKPYKSNRSISVTKPSKGIVEKFLEKRRKNRMESASKNTFAQDAFYSLADSTPRIGRQGSGDSGDSRGGKKSKKRKTKRRKTRRSTLNKKHC